jgi:hypothetical protein
MDNLTQDEQKALQDLYGYVVEQLFHLERNPQDVQADLVAKGYPNGLNLSDQNRQESRPKYPFPT